jgi:hypothetical protein
MRKGALAIIGILILLIPVGVYAAACPEVVSLGDLTGPDGFEPLRMALGDGGELYVTDNYNDTVYVYNYKGDRVKTLSIEKPLGVAVDSQGRVYIGRATGDRGVYTGEVNVYDSDLNFLGALGAGLGEFEYPISIAVDGEQVYVADNRVHVVRVYDMETRERLYSFGGNGHSAGDLNNPVALTIHPSGNLYIADRAQFYYRRVWGPGAGGHVFGTDGTYIQTFGSFATTGAVGTISVPGGIDADGSGRVYISDYSTGNVQIFSESGGALCAFATDEYTMNLEGLEIGQDGRMLVAAFGRVFVYGLDSYVRLVVSPSSLSFEAQQCGAAPEAQAITISNDGPGVLQWEISTGEDWIVPSLSAGEINGEGSVNVGISVDPAMLGSGTHKGTVSVTAPGASVDVSVKVSMTAPPELGVSPDSFSFEVKGSELPPAETLNVELLGDTSGAAVWEASTGGSAWLGISPTSGSSNSLTMVSVSIDGAALDEMEAGDYTGTITVSSDCATGSPADVPVSLTYIKGGTIQVTTNVAEAGFTITGPETYTGGGTSYLAEAVPEGTYTIMYEAVQGFKAPSGTTLSVLNGATAEFVGEYIDLRESNNIIASMGGGQWFVPQEVRVFDAGGLMYGSVTVSSGGLEDSKQGKKGGASKEGIATAAGDLDGDGLEDIVVCYDQGAIVAYTAEGAVISGINFRAFEYESDIDVSVADLDGDGLVEIIVGGGSKSGDQAAVRVFGYSGGAVYDTGVNFLAYDRRDGVNVASGDIDGDGLAEILTVPGVSGRSAVEVRVWKVSTAGGAGAWDVVDAGGFEAGTSHYGADITAADLDADAVDEIIVSTVPKPSDRLAAVAAYGADGTQVLGFAVETSGRGVEIAAGDMDMDGSAEIVVAEGVDPQSSSLVRVYGPDGILKGEFNAFDDLDIYGSRVSLGQVVE